jgi:glycosyltransferase involved in cell wall biosynthesis
MVVNDRHRDDHTILAPAGKLAKGWSKVVPSIDAIPLPSRVREERLAYSVQWLPDRLLSRIGSLSPDIVHLHWINAGFVRIETLAKLNRPLVWTLHDMWPFTGGCHYSGECDRYTKSCGACPQLQSERERDLSRWVWRRKLDAWRDIDLTVVSPSRWLADLAARSSLFSNTRIEIIPNGLDLQRYKPIDKKLAKQLLGLSPEKKALLFGAVGATGDRRKGFHLLQPALQKLAGLETWRDRLESVVFGSSTPADPPDFGFTTRYLGRLDDDISLALLYAAADVFVAPSIQDNLPNTVMEALACGTPCVAFNIGGMAELIDHRENGYLAEPFESEDFCRGIRWVLEKTHSTDRLARRAREKAEREFSLESWSRNYSILYESLLDREDS